MFCDSTRSAAIGCDAATADRICCFNRHYAEHSGYAWSTSWVAQTKDAGETTYYDTVSGKPLFKAPVGRTFKEFLHESKDGDVVCLGIGDQGCGNVVEEHKLFEGNQFRKFEGP